MAHHTIKLDSSKVTTTYRSTSSNSQNNRIWLNLSNACSVFNNIPSYSIIDTTSSIIYVRGANTYGSQTNVQTYLYSANNGTNLFQFSTMKGYGGYNSSSPASSTWSLRTSSNQVGRIVTTNGVNVGDLLYTSPHIYCFNDKILLAGSRNWAIQSEIHLEYSTPHVVVTTSVNNASMGTISGAGTYDYDKTGITIQATPNTGYRISSWSGFDAGNAGTSSTRTYSASQLINAYDASQSFTVNFEGYTYYIKYDGNGATNTTMSNSTHVYGTSKNLTANAFSRPGYTFLGWSTNKQAKSATYANQASVNILPSSHGATITLYAIWSAIPDINYENLFSLSNWINSASSNYSHSSVEYDNANGTIKLIETGGSSERYTTFTGSGIYIMPIDNTANYELSFDLVTSGCQARVMVFNTTTDLQGWDGYVVDTGGISSGNNYKYTFSAKNQYIHIRFGTVSGNGNAKFSNIKIYKQARKTEIQRLSTFRNLKTLSSLPTPSITGYTFNGWYKNENLSGNSLTVSEAQNITTGITVYSKWTVKTPTVTFNSNGGNSISAKTFTYNQPYGTLTEPIKTGHTFQGWYYKDTNTLINSNSIVTDENDHVLTAKWVVNTYVIQFYSDNSLIHSVSIKYGDKYTGFPNISKKCHIFNGWQNSTGSIVDTNTLMLTDSNHSLTASWTRYSYTINFNGNGDDGTGAMTSQKFTYLKDNQKLTKNTFSKLGYQFNGWNTSADGSGQSFIDEQSMINYEPISNNQSITLYAQWLFTAINNIKIDNLKVTNALLDSTKIVKILIDKILIYSS